MSARRFDMLNIKFNKIIYLLFMLLGFLFISACNATSPSVVTSITNNNAYYHLKYSLTKENITYIDSFTGEQFIINGGQFEIRLKKSEFPISSPNCKSDLILRMPWTNPEIVNSYIFIAEKYEVFHYIQNLTKSSQPNAVDIYVELNPYVELKEGEFSLTQCNIYFRQSKGQYISKIGNLK
ncbi:hypothetical protein Ping_1824 [Psychromonas ingrahamii 37]|uniref:Lipoprotein n=2 Tax=Psychromonas ingrahamii TaxID=357794 RepID=A1SVT6_PSYIN|nr:hypothetical protein Ping_1824 [Psychromonas ingrahamii 37]